MPKSFEPSAKMLELMRKLSLVPPNNYSRPHKPTALTQKTEYLPQSNPSTVLTTNIPCGVAGCANRAINPQSEKQERRCAKHMKPSPITARSQSAQGAVRYVADNYKQLKMRFSDSDLDYFDALEDSKFRQKR